MVGLVLDALVGLHAKHHVVPVHQVAVELGAVHADELGLAAHGNTAAAAHPRAVHHDGVEGYHGVNPVGLGGGGAEFHHDGGADGHGLIGGSSALAELLEGLSHEALPAVGAVVGHHGNLVRGGPHLFLEDHEALGPGAHDHLDRIPRRLVGLHDGIEGSHADAAAHADHGAHLFDTGGAAQGPEDGRDLVADLFNRQAVGGGADGLEHQGDPALLDVCVGDGEGYALPEVGIDLDQDELAGLAVAGDFGSLHAKVVHLVGKLFFLKNGMHGVSSSKMTINQIL